MLKLAIEDKMEVEKIGLEAKTKLYAVDTFRLIKEKYSNDNIFFIMGSDNFRKMPEWKGYKELKANYSIIVVEREKKTAKHEEFKNIIEFIPENLAKIDSTKIRKKIKNNENVEGYLNPKVIEYIKQNKLYT